MFKETIPIINDLTDRTPAPKELYSFTKDVSDYAWYSTSIKIDARDLPMRPDVRPGIHIASLGHALLAFVNGEYIGFEHGSNVEKSHIFRKPVNLKPGDNNITLLAMTVGFPNSGAYMEKRFAGPRAVTLEGLMSGTLDITNNKWGQQVPVYTEEGAKTVKWVPFAGTPSPVTWYKTYFDAPEGTNPVALRMMSMAKGMVWVNGQSIGRYWVSYNSPLGRPTQEEYHVPRSFLKPKDNLLVVFEETGGNPEKIDILVVNRDTICSVITEYHPPSVNSWERKGDELRALVNPVREAELTCPDKKVIKKVEFVGFGEVDGACGAFKPGKCNSNSKAIKLVESLCLGRKSARCHLRGKDLLMLGKTLAPMSPRRWLFKLHVVNYIRLLMFINIQRLGDIGASVFPNISKSFPLKWHLALFLPKHKDSTSLMALELELHFPGLKAPQAPSTSPKPTNSTFLITFLSGQCELSFPHWVDKSTELIALPSQELTDGGWYSVITLQMVSLFTTKISIFSGLPPVSSNTTSKLSLGFKKERGT
ncbi:UNVERIFIED_CONTAM: Beta-galactosidase 13 [Sesamum radiatum]|uniref:beta-galactosidase n=1 Tax=Sesamum radiatum TaxID=300843 RepID=A0AAW2S2X8_SESRA